MLCAKAGDLHKEMNVLICDREAYNSVSGILALWHLPVELDKLFLILVSIDAEGLGIETSGKMNQNIESLNCYEILLLISESSKHYLKLLCHF